MNNVGYEKEAREILNTRTRTGNFERIEDLNSCYKSGRNLIGKRFIFFCQEKDPGGMVFLLFEGTVASTDFCLSWDDRHEYLDPCIAPAINSVIRYIDQINFQKDTESKEIYASARMIIREDPKLDILEEKYYRGELYIER